MWGWDSICSAARKIDRTVREDAPAKLKQYTPDPKQLQHVDRYCAGSYPAEKLSDIPKIMQGNWDSVCFVDQKIDKTVKENAPYQRFLITAGKYALEDFIMGSGLPGVRRLYRAWKESLRNRSGVASQMHSHDKVNGERNRLMNVKGQRGRSVMLSQAIFILTNHPFSSEPTIKALCSRTVLMMLTERINSECE